MGNFPVEGQKAASIRPRHIEQIGGDIESTRRSEAAASKVTQPMVAVAPPEFNDVNAAAEPQETLVAGTEPRGPKTLGLPESQLSNTGKTLPQPLTSDEQRSLEQAATERNRVLRISREADLSALPEAMQNILRRAENAVRDHMKPDDLAAVIKEERGVEITNAVGRVYDHVAEVETAREGVLNAIATVKDELGRVDAAVGGYGERELLQAWLSRYSKFLDTVKSKI